MSLSSVLQTGLSGFQAAGSILDNAANNLANSNTPGYKSTRVNFSTQPPSTTPNGSGSIQIGNGVRVSGNSTDFSNGSLATNEGGSTLALQGRGLFILEGPGEQFLFTRNGRFNLNSKNELTTVGGQRLLGFQADAMFKLNRNKLSALQIPIGRQFQSANGQTRTLTDFEIESNGNILGRFNDGSSETIAQIQLAKFRNPNGLIRRGNNQFSEGISSGAAEFSDPGANNAATIISGATELSNVDIGQNLIDLTKADILARSSLRVIDTAVGLFDELLMLSRPR